MKKTLALLIMLTIFLSMFTGCKTEINPINSEAIDPISKAGQTSNLNGRLTLNGSTSMTKLCNSLAEAFMEENPGVTVEKSDTGSGSAINAVKKGTTLIGDLSRQVKDDEKEDIEFKIIAIDAIAVIVNENNPVDNVSFEDLGKIFKGEITNWSELGGRNQKITLIGREESSGTREGFESIVGIKGESIYHAEYPESGDIVSKVSSDDSAIGYCSLFSVFGNIKPLKINSVEIKEDNIKNGSYKIQRPFIQAYLKGEKNILIDSWFEFIKSDKGKTIIEREKLIPTL